MKLVLLTIMFMFLISCGADNNASAGNDVDQAVEQSDNQVRTVNKGQVAAGITSACEAVDTDVVAEIMGWDASKTITDEVMNRKDGELTVCLYMEKGGAVQIMARVSHENKNAQAKKRLENQYKKMLAGEIEKIEYETVATILGSQTLQGYGEGIHNYKSYILRSRDENKFDVSLEISTDQSDKSTIQSRLKAIMKAMVD